LGRFRTWILRKLLREDFSRLEREIREEFRFHIDMKASSFMDQGLDSKSARRAAEDCFGDSHALLREGLRTLTGAHRIERRKDNMVWFSQDLQDGARRILRHPGFSLLVAGTLALGLSTSTAVFTYVNAYRQPFPGADGSGLFQVFQSSGEEAFGAISYPDFLDLASLEDGGFRVTGTAQSLFAASVRHETLTEVAFGQSGTGAFFSTLGVEMSLGRGLDPEDDRPGAEPTVVISHEYWGRRYGSDPEVLGATIFLNNEPYTIVGVAGPRFLGSSSAFRPQIWIPFEQYKRVYWARDDREINREVPSVSPYVRLAGGAEVGRVEQALAALAANLDREAPLADRTRRFILQPATWIHPSVRQAELPTTRIMLVAAVSLLLLACANVANLMLSAGARRDQEMALRAAVGASRGRLFRQLLTENLLISLVAGGLALAVAGPAGNRLSSYFARPSVWGANVPREISIDLSVLGFAGLAAVLTGLLAGLVPALRASRRDPAPALKAGLGRSSERQIGGGTRLLGTRHLLVSIQVAISIVLLFVAGLVVRTLDSARDVDPGFNVDWTLASYISTSSMGTPVSEREEFFRDVVRRFETMPWVQAATVAEMAPLSGHPRQDLRPGGSDEPVSTTVAKVVPGYFETMEMQIVLGRSFLPTDTVDSRGVVVVNETLAGILTGGTGAAVPRDALGRNLWWPAEGDSPERQFEVVGVVGNARQTSLLEEPGPVAYFSFPQHYYRPGNAFLLKVTGNPQGAVQRMEEELRAIDPRIAIVNILPYSEVVAGFLYTQRMNAELFSLIAFLGLILSAAGIFGVVSLAVAQRRKEIGIRLAIGADPRAVVNLVVSRISFALILGLAAGLAGAFFTTRWIGSLLWGVSPADPLALSVGAGVLTAVIALAVGVPVRRAIRIDPVRSLRVE
jgi:putative ABC transport system permease protein